MTQQVVSLSLISHGSVQRGHPEKKKLASFNNNIDMEQVLEQP